MHTPANKAVDASSTINAQNSGWHFLVGVCDQANSNVLLYVDGVVAESVAIAPLTGLINTAADSLMVGARPTSATSGANNQFQGLIENVAVFNYALSSNQVVNQYLMSGVPASLPSQPPTNAFVAPNGSLLIAGAAVFGTPPLVEQWWDATSNTPLAGQTNSVLAISNSAVAADWIGHQVYLTVSNIYGGTSSVLVMVNSNSGPVITAQSPVSYASPIRLYAGASLSFSITASAPTNYPISYQWFTNSVKAGGKTNTFFQLTNAQLTSPANFYCVAGNAVGTTTSMVWSVIYVAAPTAPFPQSVLALNPMAYWRLNEPDDGAFDGNPGAIAYDYVGGNDGIYTNALLGQAGYDANTDPTETSAYFGEIASSQCFVGQIGTNIDFSTPAGSNAEFTIEAWVNGLNVKPTDSSGAGIVGKGYFSEDGSAEATLDEGAPNEDFRLEVHTPNNAAYDANSTINAQSTGWHFLVGVCDEANSNVLLYVDGVLAGSAQIPPLSGITNTVGVPLMIGARPTSALTGGNNQFVGLINDVAVFNYALTPSQVLNQYLVAGVPPAFVQQPAANAFVTLSGLAVPSTIIGTPPLTNQWWDATLGAPIAGQTNATLAISNIVAANSLIGHQVYLAVANACGATNSALVTVNSNSSPVITVQFPLSYTNQITLYAGANPAFSIAATSPAGEPISYYWFTNGVRAANTTNAACSLTSVQLNSPTNIYCVASNVAGTTTSMVWSVTCLAAPTAPFPQSVLALKPVAYWPLNEADDGLNDGNPGALAIDYVGGNNAIYTNVNLGQTGYNTSTDPTGTAALFGSFTPTGSFAGQIGTNIDFSAPVGSNAEFTIEAWVNGLAYKPTDSSGAGIVGKGYFGSKGSAEVTLDEGAPNEDFRLEVHTPANKADDASSTINAQNSGWHFLAGVCDEANGHVLLYVDGVPAGSVPVAPLTGIINTAADSLMIGARPTSATSGANNQFQGLIDNVAIYNYALTANQIATQYQAGTSPIVNATATNIVFSVSNNQMTLSWPADHTGWQLQAQTNSLGTNWVTIGGSSATNQVLMAINPSNNAVFYRLVYSK